MDVYMAFFVYFAICIWVWKTVEKSRKFSTGLWKSLWIAVKSSKIKGFFHRFFHNFCGKLLSSVFDKKMHFLLFSQMLHGAEMSNLTCVCARRIGLDKKDRLIMGDVLIGEITIT